MVKKIKLTKGKKALVDDLDFEWLNQWKWHVTYYGYAARSTGTYKLGNKRAIYMHRLIMGVTDKKEVDHRDFNPLNNQRKNLRICTHAQNNMHKKHRIDNKSGYKGVSLHRQTGKWTAEIQTNGKRVRMGLFITPEEAYGAYCKAAKKYHGEFARTK